MNIISYVIDALEEVNDSWVKANKLDNTNYLSPTIRICTHLLNSTIAVVHIANNAVGITEKVSKKFFDPLFYTKSTGKLTELELSTSYEIIVEKHGGQIEWISGLEQSTEFIIKLPI